MNSDNILSVLSGVVQLWIIRVLVGLIFIDLATGVAAALKAGEFKLAKLAKFYASSVIPYLLGYAALWLAVNFILPIEAGPASQYGNVALLGIAQAALIGTLGGSITQNILKLWGVTLTGAKPQ